jgi:hypothetical protein
MLTCPMSEDTHTDFLGADDTNCRAPLRATRGDATTDMELSEGCDRPHSTADRNVDRRETDHHDCGVLV